MDFSILECQKDALEKGFYSFFRFNGKKDLNGKKPSIYLACNNRTSGKTTAISTLCIEAWRKGLGKFCILYRTKYETYDAHTCLLEGKRVYEEVTGDALEELCTEKRAQGLYTEIYCGEESIGYAMYLKSADKLKKYSAKFFEIERVYIDEIMLETGEYLKDEPALIESLLMTIARGGGQRTREVELYLLGNRVSDVNPYYHHFKIHERMEPGAKFIRGNGWILDCETNKEAAEAVKSNTLFDSFANADSTYMDYAAGDRELKKLGSYITKTISGKNRYICTVLYNEKPYGIREYYQEGILFVTEKFDRSCQNVFSVTSGNIAKNTMAATRNSMAYKMLEMYYNLGGLYFSSIGAQNCAYEILAIKLYK